jgi:hypothetical protein
MRLAFLNIKGRHHIGQCWVASTSQPRDRNIQISHVEVKEIYYKQIIDKAKLIKLMKTGGLYFCTLAHTICVSCGSFCSVLSGYISELLDNHTGHKDIFSPYVLTVDE